MDIRCFRLIPYAIDDKVLLDIQQVLPLPEAADYQVRLRRKDVARERARSAGRDFTRYHIAIDGEALAHQNKRNAVRTMVEQLRARASSTETDRRGALAVPGTAVAQSSLHRRRPMCEPLTSQFCSHILASHKSSEDRAG
jgi:hypothetical protein